MDELECIKAFNEGLKQKRQKEFNKKENNEIRLMREKIKTTSDWRNELQTLVNRFVLLRDKGKPCISCGTTKESIKYDAGHFYSRGAYPNLRFYEDNIHRQCSNNCNLNLHGNFPEYQLRLPERIGIERYNLLLSKLNAPLQLSLIEIKEKIIYYKQKIKDLK